MCYENKLAVSRDRAGGSVRCSKTDLLEMHNGNGILEIAMTVLRRRCCCARPLTVASAISPLRRIGTRDELLSVEKARKRIPDKFTASGSRGALHLSFCSYSVSQVDPSVRQEPLFTLHWTVLLLNRRGEQRGLLADIVQQCGFSSCCVLSVRVCVCVCLCVVFSGHPRQRLDVTTPSQHSVYTISPSLPLTFYPFLIVYF